MLRGKPRLEFVRAATGTLQAHHLDAAAVRCTCGWEFESDRQLAQQQARHVAELLADAAPGLA